jgi:hypothetical protein
MFAGVSWQKVLVISPVHWARTGVESETRARTNRDDRNMRMKSTPFSHSPVSGLNGPTVQNANLRWHTLPRVTDVVDCIRVTVVN